MSLACKTRPASHGRPRLLWALCLLPLLAAAPAFSQSLGEIARQERERKQNQPHRATHVYTNEDLARPQILLPQDRERIQTAQRKAAPPASVPAAEVGGSDSKAEALSLGEIARRYRALQQAQRIPQRQMNAPQPAVDAPALAHPTFSRLPVRIAAPPTPPRFTSPQRLHAPHAPRTGEARSGGLRIRVQRGDTLWKLAKEYLGRGSNWLLLAALNPHVTDPARLQIGTWVRLPSEAPTWQPLTRVRVERGDSLWKLALGQFGNGLAWNCIAEANPQLANTDLIFPGQLLAIPASCKANP